jgi:hypothetical protein
MTLGRRREFIEDTRRSDVRRVTPPEVKEKICVRSGPLQARATANDIDADRTETG